jgi:putative ABC transport system permease protein
MMRRVSLARKNLFEDRRRAALAVLGIGAAFVLVLVLDGIFAGAMNQVTAYIRNSPADVFVAQRDVKTMHMSASALPPATLDKVRAVDGVSWAEGLRYTTSTVDVGSDSLLTYVLGYDITTGRGGPRRITRGQPPSGGQALVDNVAADELGVTIGDSVTILGRPFIISGLSTDGTYIANTTVFITADDFAALRGPTYAYILVGARAGTPAGVVEQRLADVLPQTTVMSRDEFAREEANVVRSMAADIMAIMSIIGFLIALALIGLTLFTATITKQREYGVLKALGARTRRLVAVVLAQAAWTVAFALALAVALAVAIGTALGALTPNLEVDIGLTSVLRTSVAALVVGSLAALLPLRRVTRVDPATAFRRP